jgi:RNA polymerase sigma-70 factor (ECF subfamily)
MTREAKARLIPFRRKASNVEALSDEALLAACSTGDPNALAQLFDRLCDDVTRFLGRLAYVDTQDVQDLVNESFLAIFRSAGSYRSDASVKTWVFAIVANIARERCRKATRGRAATDMLARDFVEPERTSLESAVIAKRLIAQVEDCIPALPWDLRLAFLMCDVEELPGVDVARALGVPKGTLYRRLHDARQLLRTLIEGAGQ